jgi:hypothetical protein
MKVPLFERPQTPLPTEPTYTDLTPSHLESALPTVLSGTYWRHAQPYVDVLCI